MREASANIQPGARARRGAWLTLGVLLLSFGLLHCGGPSHADCERVCKEAHEGCTDKNLDKCIDRCEEKGDASTVADLKCSGHGTCCGGLCCLGFYYDDHDTEQYCSSNATYSCY